MDLKYIDGQISETRKKIAEMGNEMETKGITPAYIHSNALLQDAKWLQMLTTQLALWQAIRDLTVEVNRLRTFVL